MEERKKKALTTKQMVKMMYEYFSSSKNSPALIGHRFYESSNEMIFQLELEADSTKVNKMN